MKKIYHLVLALTFPFFLAAQNYYFPPLTGDEWETISPASLGWCEDKLTSALNFLEEKNTKAFIILKDGKIAVEQYFGDFGQDSLWYWASAGKTLTGYLVGIAQEEGLLDLDDKTSDYLGAGWTSAPPEKEDLITIQHQLSMSTGLNDDVPDANCLDPSCLNYLADAGGRWSYYNAPYRLLQDVVAAASGKAFQVYTFQKVSNKIGMTGAWFNYVFYSTPRSMARFGSLVLSKGNWDGNTVLADQVFQNEMINTSQDFNLSYGYLWWLNGKGSYMLPQSQLVFNTDLIPNAPDEMYSALGKNDQKIYILPSQNIVVIRMGDSAGIPLFALSNFDNELWGMLDNVFCEPTDVDENFHKKEVKVFPNPTSDFLNVDFDGSHNIVFAKLYNSLGQEVKSVENFENQINISSLPEGNYFVHFLDENKNSIHKERFLKIK